MKKYLAICFLLAFVIFACTNDEDAFYFVKTNVTRSTQYAEIEWDKLDTLNFVSEQDIHYYINFKKLLAESSKEAYNVISVEPMRLDNEAILGYIVNRDNGWELVSADKRSPIVLANSDEGTFNLNEMPDNVRTWTKCLLYDVAQMRNIHELPKNIEQETLENIEASTNFWKAITCDDEYIASNIPTTRVMGDVGVPRIIGPDSLLPGHWELIETTITNREYHEINHLITTSWDQYYPYNMYCPIEDGQRCLAGCVAIAGAQELAYLHNKIGRPIGGPTYAYSYYRGGGGYSYDYGYSMTSPIWDSIYIDDSWAATLISYVGINVGMTYHPGGSSATTSNLVSLFSDNGIQCSYQAYSPSVVYTHLKDGLPVVTRAKVPGSSSGHCFIIDAYKEEIDTYTLTYRYIVEQPLEGPLYRISGDNYRIEICVHPPFLHEFSMNWGWGFIYNTTWCSPTGTWLTANGAYDDSRYMIVGYSPM